VKKRALKKAILAEALAVFRNYNFGCRSCLIDTKTGEVTRIYSAKPFEPLDDLRHLCTQLETKG